MNPANARTERTAFAASLVLHVAFAIAVVAKLPSSAPDTPASPLRILLASSPEPARAAVREESRTPSPVTRAPAQARPLARAPLPTPASNAPVIREVETSSTAPASDVRTSDAATPASGPAPAAPAPAPAQPSAPVFDAAYLENPAPNYPRAARRGGIEGRVVLRVLVNPSGTADEVLVRSSSGHDALDEAARATVARWRFVPARMGERAVSAWVLVPVSFHLDS